MYPLQNHPMSKLHNSIICLVYLRIIECFMYLPVNIYMIYVHVYVSKLKCLKYQITEEDYVHIYFLIHLKVIMLCM